MSARAERLWQLVPGWHRGLDDRNGGALRRLVAVLADEIGLAEDAAEALLDGHFVERAAPHELPRLAELLGARLLGVDVATTRAVLARSVDWRRRKGTLGVLEEAVSVSAGWSAEAEEGHLSVAWIQDVQAPLPERGRTASLWDPIAAADPLSRRPARPRHGFEPTAHLGQLPGESADGARRRLGRADALRPATLPALPDFNGWVRPDTVLVRTDRFAAVEMEEVRIAEAAVEWRAPGSPTGARSFLVDPLGRPTTLAWREPVRPDPTPITGAHEPDLGVRAPGPTAVRILTPTALAADPDAVLASGAFQLSVDGVPLVARPRVEASPIPLASTPLALGAPLRFADASRVATGDSWTLALVAHHPGADGDPDTDDTLVTGNGLDTPTVAAGAGELRAGATVRLHVTRVAGAAWSWRAQSGWVPVPLVPPPGRGLSNAVHVTTPGGERLLRVEAAPADGARLAHVDPDDLGAGWGTTDLSFVDGAFFAGAGLAAAGSGGMLYVVGGAETGELGLWRVAEPTGAGEAVRLDTPAIGRPLPRPRRDAAVLVHAGRVWVYGGDADGELLGDLWSVDAAGGAWTVHFVRGGPPRRAPTLLADGDSFWLVGGQAARGALALETHTADLSRGRPAWRRLAAFPGEAGRGGQLAATRVQGALVALAWIDATAAGAWTLVGNGWEAVPPVVGDPGPLPPSDGELVWQGDTAWMIAPAPLPPSDIVVATSTGATLVQVPALPLSVGDTAVLAVSDDGGSRRVDDGLAPDQPGPWSDLGGRPGDGGWYARPGRLDRAPYKLRQRHLGRWPDAPVQPDADVIGLDPRTGRVLLPPGAPHGVYRASFLGARPARLGAGCLPPRRDLPEAWGAAPAPPDLGTPAIGVTAWLSPDRAGTWIARDRVELPVHATPAAAIGDEPTAVVGVVGSPRVAASRVVLKPDQHLVLFAADDGATPIFDRDPVDADIPAIELLVPGGSEGAPDPSAPTRWLAGLLLDGRLELVVPGGAVDLRWCTLGRPGEVGLRVPGAGWEGAELRRSLPTAEIELRLYGCVVGVAELPPWVRLVAAGCTFDAGTDNAPAIRAAGAHVVLRHCTVRGGIDAGVLEASSCVVSGETRTDRRDLGWLRWSVVAPATDGPRRFHCVELAPPFAAVIPTDPRYLALLPAADPRVLGAGEHGRTPGAHHDHAARVREVEARTDDFLPLALVAHHDDRASRSVLKMNRRRS